MASTALSRYRGGFPTHPTSKSDSVRGHRPKDGYINSPAQQSTIISLGEVGPDFTLEGTRGDSIQEFTLSEFAAGRPTVLVFYLYDFSPICTTQLCEVDDMELLTFNDDAAVLGISTDGPYSHQRSIEENQISYPLLSDPDKEVYEKYGMVERTESGKPVSQRGVVLLDSDRTVEYVWQAEDRLETWTMEPLHEINDRINELIA